MASKVGVAPFKGQVSENLSMLKVKSNAATARISGSTTTQNNRTGKKERARKSKFSKTAKDRYSV